MRNVRTFKGGQLFVQLSSAFREEPAQQSIGLLDMEMQARTDL